MLMYVLYYCDPCQDVIVLIIKVFKIDHLSVRHTCVGRVGFSEGRG